VQTVLDAHLHFNTRIRLGIRRQRVHKHILLLDDIREALYDSQPQKVSQLNISARVRLVVLVHVREIEINGHVLGDLARVVEQLAKRGEHVMVAAVVVELYLTDELQSDALVFNFSARLFELYLNSAAYVFAVVVDELLDFFALLHHLDCLACASLVEVEFYVTARPEPE